AAPKHVRLPLSIDARRLSVRATFVDPRWLAAASFVAMKFTPAKPPLTGETLDSLTEKLRAQGEPAFRAKQILEWLYKKRARSWDEMTNLSRPLRAWLAETFDLMPASLVLNQQSHDVTDKLLLELRDGSLIETVIIRAPQEGVGLDHSRKTICISTQGGC